MQAEGLALAVGGRDALRELLEQGRPLLAAHGPYTAAGTDSDFMPNLAAPVGLIERYAWQIYSDTAIQMKPSS